MCICWYFFSSIDPPISSLWSGNVAWRDHSVRETSEKMQKLYTVCFTEPIWSFKLIQQQYASTVRTVLFVVAKYMDCPCHPSCWYGSVLICLICNDMQCTVCPSINRSFCTKYNICKYKLQNSDFSALFRILCIFFTLHFPRLFDLLLIFILFKNIFACRKWFFRVYMAS